jgi:hypothetical protein
MSDDFLEELIEAIEKSGCRVAFGLRNQGHYEKVTKMREEGKSWAEIGRVIGWDGETVRKHYEMEEK